MTECDVAHFVAEYAFHFIVVHHVHQTTVYADTAVRHRPGVDVFGQIHLIVGRRAVDIIAQRCRDFFQALCIFTAVGRNLCLFIHFFTRLHAQRFDVGIAQRIRLISLCAGLH
ncbi:hypothetical protein D3C80_1616660 [compost metagenome]